VEIHLRTTGCRLPYGITPATQHKQTHPRLNPTSVHIKWTILVDTSLQFPFTLYFRE